MPPSVDRELLEAPLVYEWLMAGASDALCDPFDAHVLASALALAIAEAGAAEIALDETTGLGAAELAALTAAAFPHAVPAFEHIDTSYELAVPEDERSLRELLLRYSTARTPLQGYLATLIARRSMRPNHLWQDLGLRDRAELGALMERHFKPLRERNAGDMKWKKFLYRMICRDEGFRLCTAPSCAECGDFPLCFGDESGESFLARNRRELERSAASAVA
jgi:nitrogen fixation protein NifQ